MLMLLNNLFFLAIFFFVSFFVFKLLLSKDKLFSKTISVFLALQVILVAFILIEQHRFKTNLSRSIFMDDGEIYSSNAWQISTALTGIIPDIKSVAQMRGIHLADRGLGLKRYYSEYIKKKIIPPASEYHIRYITYLYSIIYAAYGFIPVSINFMNVILHLLTVVLIYKSVVLLFDDKIAYLSCLFFLINPISFYYSSTKLQEAIFIFILYSSIHCFLMIIKKRKYLYIPLMLALFYVNYSFLKTDYFIPILFAFIISSIIILFRNNKRAFLILTLFIILCLSVRPAIIGKIKFYVETYLSVCVSHQRGFYNTGGQVYQLFIPGKEIQDYTFLDWVRYAPRAWYHMLSEPILSSKASLSLLLFFPVKVIFLILCVLALLGTLMAMRYGQIEAVIFVSIFVILGTGIAMSSGNVGTMLRHRDIISPVVFIFSAFYITRFLQKIGFNNMRKG